MKMLRENEIKTLEDAYDLVWYMSTEVVQESVFDSVPGCDFTIGDFADILVNAGVITQKAADDYVAKFGKHTLTDIDLCCDESEPFRYLTRNRVDWDDEEDWDDGYYKDNVETHQALFYAAAVLYSDEYRREIFDDLTEFVGEHKKRFSGGFTLDNIKDRASYEMPAIPIDVEP